VKEDVQTNYPFSLACFSKWDLISFRTRRPWGVYLLQWGWYLFQWCSLNIMKCSSDIEKGKH
jgi:hypothetical protein